MIVNTTKDESRLHWVDAAKGILILLVAMHHMIQRGNELDISCRALDAIHQTEIFWVPIFMATFFIVTGFWAKYDMSFKDFVVKNAKSLLLPLIVFSYLGGILHELFYEILKHTYNENALTYPSVFVSLDYWFILALFIAKCMYWLIYRYVKNVKIRWIVTALVYLMGVLSLKAWFLPDYSCWKWAMVLMIYLPLGQVFKDRMKGWKLFPVALLLYLGVWMLLYFNSIEFPLTTGGMKNMDLARALPSFILCTAGSFVFLKLCSLIKRARVLELLGRSTLAIYIMHSWIEVLAMKTMRSFFSQGVWVSTLATIITIVVSVFLPCLISELLNRPKLKWILGK